MFRLLFISFVAFVAAHARTLDDPAGHADSMQGIAWNPASPAGADTTQQSGRPGDNDVLDVDQQPTIVKKVNPVYPPEALGKELEGSVWLKIRIDEAGKVVETSVLKSTNDLFNQSALDAARQFVFTPAYKDKKPIAVWVTLPFKFKVTPKKDTLLENKAAQQCEEAFNLVIRGTGAEELKAVIFPGAHMINGGMMVNLLAEAQKREKSGVLVAESKRRRSLLRISVYEGEGIGYGIWKSEETSGRSPRYHTIVFQKSTGGRWMIQEWHTSH